MKDLIRTIVVKTNPIPPFSYLNRIPYSLAINKVKQLSGNTGGITSLYLRHGLTRPDWEPGLSDIDFTMVLKNELTAEEEFKTNRQICDSYNILKRVYPMLGELEIFNESCCSSWSRFSIRGFETREWKLLCGTATIESAYSGNSEDKSKDELDHACIIFETQVLRRFFASESISWIDTKALWRICRKLLRYTGKATGSGPAQSANPTVMLQLILERLDTRTQESLQKTRSAGKATCADIQMQCEMDRPHYYSSRYSGLLAYDEFILSIMLSFSVSFVVLKDDIPADAMTDLLDGVRSVCAAEGIRPLLMTRSLFEYYLRFCRPALYLEMQEYRHIYYGEDLLAGIPEPTGNNLALELMNQTLNVMLAPASLVSDPNLLQDKGWLVDVERFMLVMLYLDRGFIGSHQFSMDAFEQLFPDRFREIELLIQQERTSEKHTRRIYSFLRQCALDINHRIHQLDAKKLPQVRTITASFSGTVQ